MIRLKSFAKNSLGFIIPFSILLLIIIYTLANTIETDTPWIINRVDQYANTGKFIDIVHSEISGSWENFFTLINSYISLALNQVYFSYWIFNFIYSIVGLAALYKLLWNFSDKKINIYFGIICYILLAYFTGIFIGARLENIYVSSIVIELYFIYNFLKYNKYIWLYLASFVAVLGALSHPNGLVAFIVLFIFALKLLIYKKVRVIHFILNICIVCSLFYYGLFFGQTHNEFWSFFQNISNDSSHTLPFYYEPKRYITFVADHLLIAPLFLFGLLALVIYIKKYLFDFKQYFFENFLVLGSLFIIIYLTLIGAKWEYYLSLLFPFMTISIVEYIKEKDYNKKLFIIIGCILMALTTGQVFKKNEEFLSLLHIPSQRVNTIKEIKAMIKNSIIYAPIRLYIMHHYYDKFIPLEKSDIEGKSFDYVILDYDRMKGRYEEKIKSKLHYIRSFVYNGHYYNLFKVANERKLNNTR